MDYISTDSDVDCSSNFPISVDRQTATDHSTQESDTAGLCGQAVIFSTAEGTIQHAELVY